MRRTLPARQPTRRPDRAPLQRAARPSTSQVLGIRVERLRKRGSRQPGQGAPGRRPPGPRGRGGGTSQPWRQLQPGAPAEPVQECRETGMRRDDQVDVKSPDRIGQREDRHNPIPRLSACCKSHVVPNLKTKVGYTKALQRLSPDRKRFVEEKKVS